MRLSAKSLDRNSSKILKVSESGHAKLNKITLRNYITSHEFFF